MNYALLAIIIALGIFIYVYRRILLSRAIKQSVESKRQLRNQMRIVQETKESFDAIIATTQTENIKRILLGSIYKSLSSMDKISHRYENEDEANRELTACLSVLGHTCSYHQRFDNGREADIFVDNTAIIEGKLEPHQTDIDRLIGQTEDYMKLECHLYIVIYGSVNPSSIDRIKNHIIAKSPDKISLIYLPNANRRKKLEASNE